MRLLLTASPTYTPPRGGAARSNLIWLEKMVERGHQCGIIAAGPSKQSLEQTQLQDELHAQGLTSDDLEQALVNGVYITRYHGVEVHGVVNPTKKPSYLAQFIRTFKPDRILVSSEDFGQVLLSTALREHPPGVIYIAHGPEWFPFGPSSLMKNPKGTELIKKCAGLVAIGHETAKYIEDSIGIRPEVIHPPIYGSGSYPHYDCFKEGVVLLVNPCAVKGIAIFLELARRLPDIQFAALPGWGTRDFDRQLLSELPNIEILKPCESIDEVFSKTRALLVPSLWREGFGLIVVEAMLRGIPTLASNFGGLLDAKLGIDYALPVRAIEEYHPTADENGLPVPVVPEQDCGPWEKALKDLLGDRQLYAHVSHKSRKAALTFVSEARIEPFENYLANLNVKR